jgi:hypothetical protein
MLNHFAKSSVVSMVLGNASLFLTKSSSEKHPGTFLNKYFRNLSRELHSLMLFNSVIVASSKGVAGVFERRALRRGREFDLRIGFLTRAAFEGLIRLLRVWLVLCLDADRLRSLVEGRRDVFLRLLECFEERSRLCFLALLPGMTMPSIVLQFLKSRKQLLN